MKYLTILLLLLAPGNAYAFHVKSAAAGLNFNTDKVATVSGMINNDVVDRYEAQLSTTAALPGPRVVLIDSQGGYVDSGVVLIQMMEIEKALGTRQVCIVVGAASSMAFNLLTHCDVRLSVASAHMTVHKMEGWSGGRHTSRNLRQVADDLDREDEPYRQANSKAMHLTLRQYDRYADAETAWTPQQLLKLHYLDGIIKVK